MAIAEKIVRLQYCNISYNGASQLTCHASTYLATRWEAKNQTPTLQTLLDAPLPVTQILKAMLPYAEPVAKPGFLRKAKLSPSSIVIFVEGTDTPGHSCVAVGKYRIGGYNQVDWFSRPGLSNAYSEHDTRELIWRPNGKCCRIGGASAKEYTLVTVHEEDAKKVVSQLIQVYQRSGQVTRTG